MKRIKWLNVLIAIIVLISGIVLLHDAVCMVMGMSLTWIGLITNIVSLIAFVGLGGYLEEEMEV